MPVVGRRRRSSRSGTYIENLLAASADQLRRTVLLFHVRDGVVSSIRRNDAIMTTYRVKIGLERFYYTLDNIIRTAVNHCDDARLGDGKIRREQ